MAEIESRVISDLEVLRLLAWHPIRVISDELSIQTAQFLPCQGDKMTPKRQMRLWEWSTFKLRLDCEKRRDQFPQMKKLGALEESMKHCKSWSQGCLNLIVSHWQENFLHSVRRRLAWHGVQSLDTKSFFQVVLWSMVQNQDQTSDFNSEIPTEQGHWVHCFLVFSRTFGLGETFGSHTCSCLLHSTAFRLVDLRFYLSM
jgi:hypothetical protein